MDEKYDYVENEIPERFIERVINEKLPFHIEDFFLNLISRKYGLQEVKIEKLEIDIALARFKRLEIVGEVKRKNKISRKELENVKKS